MQLDESRFQWKFRPEDRGQYPMITESEARSLLFRALDKALESRLKRCPEAPRDENPWTSFLAGLIAAYPLWQQWAGTADHSEATCDPEAFFVGWRSSDPAPEETDISEDFLAALRSLTWRQQIAVSLGAVVEHTERRLAFILGTTPAAYRSVLCRAHKRLAPLLVVGEPGCGKTFLARDLPLRAILSDLFDVAKRRSVTGECRQSYAAYGNSFCGTPAEEPMECCERGSDLPGLPQYRLLRKIGGGAFDQIWLVRPIDKECRIAISLILHLDRKELKRVGEYAVCAESSLNLLPIIDSALWNIFCIL